MAITKAMCGFCAEPMTKGQLQPAAMGGAKCKDWFGCAQRREAFLRAQVTGQVVQAAQQFNRGVVGLSASTSGRPLLRR